MHGIHLPASFQGVSSFQLFPLGPFGRFFLVQDVVLSWLLVLPFGSVRVPPGQKWLITVCALALSGLVKRMARFSGRMHKTIRSTNCI